MTLWNILGWSVSILVGLFYLENLSRAQLGKQLPWRAARWPGGAAIGSSLAPSGGGEAQRKISSNHMGTEFLWLRDKCLTSESWQEMMAINCFNARYITNVYSVYNVIKIKKKQKTNIEDQKLPKSSQNSQKTKRQEMMAINCFNVC